MGSETTATVNEAEKSAGSTKLAILISMAMFVLVIDTAIMNVSIASISRDLNTTVSNIQAMIAIEALVSAAFILIGGKVADLIGRKRAYTLGLLGYGLGATVNDHIGHAFADVDLLGDLRRPRCFSSPAVGAVAYSRELRRPRSQEGICDGRCLNIDRNCHWAAAWRISHYIPILESRFFA